MSREDVLALRGRVVEGRDVGLAFRLVTTACFAPLL